MKSVLSTCLFALLVISGSFARAEITVISCSEAKLLIDKSKESERPIVIDTRGGYKDYFRAHIPTAHHLNFDTLRGTDLGVPVQYLPDDLTKALLTRAGVDKGRTYILYATGDKLHNEVDPIIRTTGLDRNPCVFLSRKRLCFWDSTKEVVYAKEKAIV